MTIVVGTGTVDGGNSDLRPGTLPAIGERDSRGAAEITVVGTGELFTHRVAGRNELFNATLSASPMESPPGVAFKRQGGVGLGWLYLMTSGFGERRTHILVLRSLKRLHGRSKMTKSGVSRRLCRQNVGSRRTCR